MFGVDQFFKYESGIDIINRIQQLNKNFMFSHVITD